MFSGKRFRLAGVAAVLCVASSVVLGGELPVNGDFEEDTKGWGAGAARLARVEDAFSGKGALRIERLAPTSEKYVYASWRREQVHPRLEYRLSFAAKGEGQVAACFSCYDRDRYNARPRPHRFLMTHFGIPQALSNTWRKYSFRFCPEEFLPGIGWMTPLIMVRGPAGSHAVVDKVRLTYSLPKGMIEDPYEPKPVAVDYKIDGMSIGKVYLNGELLETRGAEDIVVHDVPRLLKKGENVLAMEISELSGGATGLSGYLRFSDGSVIDVDERWKTSTEVGEDWLDAACDDAGWKQLARNDAGAYWISEEAQGTVYLRKIILWRDVPFWCPIYDCMYFPKGEASVLWVGNFSPRKAAMARNLEVVLDVPAYLELVKKGGPGGGWDYYVPRKITSERIVRNGTAYTRYRLLFPQCAKWTKSGHCPKGKEGLWIKDYTEQAFPTGGFIQAAMLALRLNGGREVGERATIYLHRESNGNLAELDWLIPMEVVGPIRGVKPKHAVFILPIPNSQYCSVFSPEERNVLLQAFLKSGANVGGGYTVIMPEVAREMNDRLAEAGVEAFVPFGRYGRELGRHPIAGRVGGLQPLHGGDKEMLDVLKEHPKLKGVFYQGTAEDLRRGGMAITDGSLKHWQNFSRNWPAYPICHSWFTSEDGKPWWDVVRKDAAALKGKLPADTVCKWLWLEECYYWHSGCYCDRCKKAFEEHIGVPGVAKLSDGELMAKYGRDYNLFSLERNYAIVGKATDIMHEYGFKTFLHYEREANTLPRSGLRGGKVDVIDGGIGGGAQSGPWMGFSRENYNANIQTLQGNPPIVIKDGWVGFMACGFAMPYDPRSEKNNFLRAMVITHGQGLDASMHRISAGSCYFWGEGTRLYSEIEDIIYHGTPTEGSFKVENFGPRDVAAFQYQGEKVLLIFNDYAYPRRAIVHHVGDDLCIGENLQTGKKYYQPTYIEEDIPAKDVLAIRFTNQRG